jgi:hypothetical protein
MSRGDRGRIDRKWEEMPGVPLYLQPAGEGPEEGPDRQTSPTGKNRLDLAASSPACGRASSSWVGHGGAAGAGWLAFHGWSLRPLLVVRSEPRGPCFLSPPAVDLTTDFIPKTGPLVFESPLSSELHHLKDPTVQQPNNYNRPNGPNH